MAALEQDQKDSFWKHGYLVIENAVSADLLARLQADFSDWVEESRRHDAAYGETLDGRPRFDLEKGHSAESPALRRVNAPIEVSDAYYEATTDSRMTDCV
ncbi:MAG: phytanoyl-CoA dioxygenase family protein, partial [Geminicoccaceae bacterium]